MQEPTDLTLARLFTAGFEGTSPPDGLLSLIRAGLGGVVLFQRNIESPGQALRLVNTLKRAGGARPLVVSIDQEGGRVARLRGDPWSAIPAMRTFAGVPEGQVRALGRLLAAELRAVGIDLDFAPVLDVDTNPANPVIGDRAFAEDPRRVAALGVALIAGLQEGGVAACGKHFPGHGDTGLDSHVALPRVGHDRPRIEAVELPPFRAAARAGVAAIMTAHVVFDALDPTVPATLSPIALAILREEMRFSGVVISDDLEMRAVADRWPIEIAAPQAIAAGCDHLLVCRDFEQNPRASAAIEREVAAGILSRARVRQAIGRWEALATTYARGPQDTSALAWLGSASHAALRAEALG